MYTGSGKIQVECISGSGKIRVGCISVVRVSDQPNGFEASFLGYFFFCQIKNLAYYYLKLFVLNKKAFEL